MNLITDTLLMYWKAGRRTKQTLSGWLTGNSPCCQDTRQRGGFIINDGDAVTFHCFNCSFKASWQPGLKNESSPRLICQEHTGSMRGIT